MRLVFQKLKNRHANCAFGDGPVISRRGAAILARARATLLLIQADELLARVEQLYRPAGPRIVYKVKATRSSLARDFQRRGRADNILAR
jgi:hypothetical protein